MKITLKKGQLTPIISFIQEIELSGAKVNRGRFRYVKLLENKSNELNQERMEVAKSYANLDKKGEAKIINNSFDIPQDKLKQFNEAQNELFAEESSLTVDDYKKQLQPFYEALNNYDKEMSGKDMIAYGTLMDSFENAGFKEGDK